MLNSREYLCVKMSDVENYVKFLDEVETCYNQETAVFNNCLREETRKGVN